MFGAGIPNELKTMIPGCYVEDLGNGKIGALIVFNPDTYGGTSGYSKRVFHSERDFCEFFIKYGEVKAKPGYEEVVEDYKNKMKESEKFSFHTLSSQTPVQDDSSTPPSSAAQEDDTLHEEPGKPGEYRLSQ